MPERTRIVLQQLGLSLLATGVVLTGLSCGGENLQPPTTGSLDITTTTSGPEPDADGYTVSIDDGAETSLGANASMQRDDIEPGSHSVRLAGIATNCTVEGQNPRSVAVTGGAVAEVSLVIACHSTTGSLEVTSATSGPSPDPDGYTITLDGTDRGMLVVNGAATLDGLTQGNHAVGLSGIAANCQVQGENPQTATVTAGASATVAFTITCAAPPPVTGTLRITTATTGPDPDPNGYAFAVDGGASQPIGVSATATLANVAAGAHMVRLSGIAANCSVQGTNPRSVTVSGGATAGVSFAVTCTATTGSLEITTTTIGGSPDPDGYTVAVDNGAPQAIGTTAALTVPGVSPGTHQVTLSGLATNCRADGNNPRSVTVTPGATATVAFSLNCAAPQTSKLAWAVANPDFGLSWRAEIWVMNSDGSGKTRLTGGGDPDYEWSPDGSRIAYSIGRPNQGESELYVTNTDGGGATQLTAGGFGPRWSPDGSKLSFTSEDQGYGEIYVVKADGSGQTKLADGGEPAWSPKGNKIAFSCLRDNNPGVCAMNADGSGQTKLADGGEPAWSPDGAKIAFVTGSGIYVMNPDGSRQASLTTLVGSDLRWSPDAATKIAFLYRSGPQREGDIYVVNADGSGLTNLTNSPSAEEGPAWSPDGHKIAFAREAIPALTDPSRDIWVMNADGTDQVQLTSGESSGTGDAGWYDDFNPTWSP